MIYVVAARLAGGGRSAERVTQWIRGQATRWAAPLPGFWIIDGPLAAEQIRNGLEPLIAPEDGLVIVKAATEAVARGIAAADAEWIAESFPGSITERIPDTAAGADGGE